MLKKIALSLCVIFSSLSYVYSQTPTLLARNFDKWGVKANLGINNSDGDASSNKSAFDLFTPKLSFGFGLTRQVTHFVGWEINYNSGTLGLSYSPYTFTTKFNQVDGRIRINFTNGQILADYRKTQIYGFVGAGMINYQSTLHTDTADIKSPKDWVHVIPVGFGFKKRLGVKTSLNLEFAYNKVNTDNLDGYKSTKSNNDGFAQLNLGLQYTLGGKKKPLEWDEPLAYFKPSQEHSVDTLVIVKKETLLIGDTTSKQPIKTLTIFYDIGDYTINGIYREDLHKLLKQLNENPESSIEIMAFCDATGSEKTNNKLVLQRSRIVSDFFANNDITANRVRVYNYGMEFAKDPILSKDRKVIIYYYKNDLDKALSR